MKLPGFLRFVSVKRDCVSYECHMFNSRYWTKLGACIYTFKLNLLIIIFCVGCQSSSKKWAVSAESQNSVKILRAMTQETVTLSWQSNYDPQPTDLTWTTEIHHTTNLLQSFQYLTETTNGFLLVPIQHNQQFFIIRNRYGLEWSDWNIKQ